jgi:ATP-binding cassette subfamily F protein 3
LKQYQGTLVFISHDVHFIRALSTHVVRVEAGQLKHFGGGYQYYLDKTQQSARSALTSSSQTVSAAQKSSEPKVDRKEQKRLEAAQRQARSNKKQEIQKRIATLEKEIADLEVREGELAVELEKPEAYANGGRATHLNRELLKIHDRLPAATTEWEAANKELAEFDSVTSPPAS